MAKTKIFRVVNGRVHFKCHSCQGKRMVAIPPGVRRRSIRCQKCGEITSCNFNRRLLPREQQRGKVLLSTNNNIVIEVDLYDMSHSGIGFDVAARDIRKISVGAEAQFQCIMEFEAFCRGTLCNYIRQRSTNRRTTQAVVTHREIAHVRFTDISCN